MKVVNYRLGGLIMLPFVTLALVIAYYLTAPWIALGSIALFGYVTAIVLIVVGKKVKRQ